MESCSARLISQPKIRVHTFRNYLISYLAEQDSDISVFYVSFNGIQKFLFPASIGIGELLIRLPAKREPPASSRFLSPDVTFASLPPSHPRLRLEKDFALPFL